MAENDAQNARPVTIYETQEMTADEIDSMNKQYSAMRVGILIVDVSRFCAKMELQPDGSYQRRSIRRKRANQA
jgi:hypothetical protein